MEEIIKCIDPEKVVKAAGYKGAGLTERNLARILKKVRQIEDMFQELGFEVVLRETQPMQENEK